jgi:hypothetical protein
LKIPRSNSLGNINLFLSISNLDYIGAVTHQLGIEVTPHWFPIYQNLRNLLHHPREIRSEAHRERRARTRKRFIDRSVIVAHPP